MALGSFLLFILILCSSQAQRIVDLVMLDKAVSDGAVCLDGSAPGYYINKTPVNRWIIHLSGGRWCYNEYQCYLFTHRWKGSSTFWRKTLTLRGFPSNNSNVNPVFAKYSVVFVPYCDGASFSGNRDDTIKVNNRTLYFRGHRILNAVLDALIANEKLDKADAILLTGCSSGGLATYLHLDYVQSKFPNVPVRGMSDAGYFIDAANMHGDMYIRKQYQYVFHMQNCSGGVDEDCIQSKNESERWQCFMAQHTYPYITTPMFVLNSLYNTWQLKNILQIGCNPPNCSANIMKLVEKWRGTFLAALQPAVKSTTNG